MGHDLADGRRRGAVSGSGKACGASGNATHRGAGCDETHVPCVGDEYAAGATRSGTGPATGGRPQRRLCRRCAGVHGEATAGVRTAWMNDDAVRARAEAMWAEDRATAGLGMRLDQVAPGRARLSMTITEAMANGHGICHGGFIFALAD